MHVHFHHNISYIAGCSSGNSVFFLKNFCYSTVYRYRPTCIYMYMLCLDNFNNCNCNLQLIGYSDDIEAGIFTKIGLSSFSSQFGHLREDGAIFVFFTILRSSRRCTDLRIFVFFVFTHKGPLNLCKGLCTPRGELEAMEYLER